jgi:hypothetical protein
MISLRLSANFVEGLHPLYDVFIVKSTITWTSWMGEVKNLASGGVGLVPPEMSIYFWA